MRKTIFLFVILLFSFSLFAQETRTFRPAGRSQPKDSLKYYINEAGKIFKEYHDQALNDERMTEVRANLNRVIAKTDNYSAVVLYAQMSAVDYDKFNADNAQAGFGKASSPAYTFGFGFAFKKNRMVYDINLAASGPDTKVKSGDEVLRTNFSTLFQVSVGYDFIKNRRFNLYPYLGIGLRIDRIESETPTELNPSAVSVAQLIAGNRDLYSSHTDFTYQAGLAFEVLVTDPKRMGGCIFFVRGGTDKAFKENEFDIHGYKYDADFKAGKLAIAAGFKFFGR